MTEAAGAIHHTAGMPLAAHKVSPHPSALAAEVKTNTGIRLVKRLSNFFTFLLLTII
jgi:hypothetical protein